MDLAQPAVFVVDDNRVQRLLLSRILAKHGFRVAVASDGAEALRRIEAGEECAIVVTDLQMPEMDGETLIRRLRANPRTAALPIVALTGSLEQDKEAELIDIGASTFITKPVDPSRLVECLQDLLAHAG